MTYGSLVFRNNQIVWQALDLLAHEHRYEFANFVLGYSLTDLGHGLSGARIASGWLRRVPDSGKLPRCRREFRCQLSLRQVRPL